MNNPPRNSWLDSLVCGAALLSLVLAMDTVRLFGSQQWLSALIGIESEYFLALFALLFPLAFWVYPRHRWLDTLLSLTSVGLLGVLFFNAETALDEAWEFGAPHWVVWCCLGLWVCLMEALRRAGGTALALIAGFFSILPLITHLLPGPLNGLEASWQDTAAYHWISIESVFGLPFRPHFF